MKKFVALLFTLSILFCLLTVPAQAYTVESDWQKGMGFDDVQVSEEGASLETSAGLTVWTYTKTYVDITDFSVTFSIDQEQWSSGGGFYQTIILGNNKLFGGSTGPFFLMMALDEFTLRFEGQIVNTGMKLDPPTVNFHVDTTQPLTMRCKLVGDNTYQVTFDGDDTTVYEFEIPVNFPFHKDMKGNAYFNFGVESSTDVSCSMTVTKINDIDLTGTPPAGEAGGNDSGSGDEEEEEGDKIVLTPEGNNTNKKPTNKGEAAQLGSTTLIILIVCIAVLVIIIMGLIAFLFLYVNKRTKKE